MVSTFESSEWLDEQESRVLCHDMLRSGLDKMQQVAFCSSIGFSLMVARIRATDVWHCVFLLGVLGCCWGWGICQRALINARNALYCF